MRVLLIFFAALLPLEPLHAEIAKPAAMVADGIPPVPDQLVADTQISQAWHLLGQNEGHGVKKDNTDEQFWASVLFWKQTRLAE